MSRRDPATGETITAADAASPGLALR